jgi:hypothetical protein
VQIRHLTQTQQRKEEPSSKPNFILHYSDFLTLLDWILPFNIQKYASQDQAQPGGAPNVRFCLFPLIPTSLPPVFMPYYVVTAWAWHVHPPTLVTDPPSALSSNRKVGILRSSQFSMADHVPPVKHTLPLPVGPLVQARSLHNQSSQPTRTGVLLPSVHPRTHDENAKENRNRLPNQNFHTPSQSPHRLRC